MVQLLLERVYQILKVAVLAVIFLPLNLLTVLIDKVKSIVGLVVISSWDFVLFVINITTPPRPLGTIGVRDKEGLWPQFVAAGPDDSRAPCPGLNAMANHGILPHSGRNITMAQLEKALQTTFNFSPSLTKATVASISKMYGRDTIDLDYLSYHNIVEHDASFLRWDAHQEPNQGDPSLHADLINKLLRDATGPKSAKHPQGYITPNDLSISLSERRRVCRKENRYYSQSFAHKFFAASNATLVIEAFGGDVAACRTIFLEERFPKGWETHMRQRKGFTQFEFFLRSAEIALRIK